VCNCFLLRLLRIFSYCLWCCFKIERDWSLHEKSLRDDYDEKRGRITGSSEKTNGKSTKEDPDTNSNAISRWQNNEKQRTLVHTCPVLSPSSRKTLGTITNQPTSRSNGHVLSKRDEAEVTHSFCFMLVSYDYQWLRTYSSTYERLFDSSGNLRRQWNSITVKRIVQYVGWIDRRYDRRHTNDSNRFIWSVWFTSLILGELVFITMFDSVLSSLTRFGWWLKLKPCRLNAQQYHNY
jgi:hypothetical protein